MAITFVQSKTATGAFNGIVTQPVVTLDAAPTAGNILISFLSVFYTGGTNFGIAAGTNWTGLTDVDDGFLGDGRILYRVVTAGASATQRPGSVSDLADWALTIVEYSGVDGSAPLDVENGIAVNAVTHTTPSVTPVASVERLVVGGTFANQATTPAWSNEKVAGITTSVNERSDFGNGTTLSACYWDKIIASTSGSYTASADGGTVGTHGTANIAIFKASTPAVGTQTLAVQIAFATNPGATPTYVDVTAYVRSISIRRGRQHELDQQQAGTATITLTNSDGRFDPTNTAGPYYPNVLPMRRIRISGNYNSINYPLFSGFIESWPQTYFGNNVAEVTITAADGFKVLGLKYINNSYPAERSDQRVGRVLDDAGWSTADRSLTTGVSTLTSATLTNVNALSHVQSVVQTENGRGFISASGGFFFQDRTVPFLTTGSNATFGTNATEYDYENIVVSYGDAQIYNEIRASIANGIDQVAADTATSQLQYFPRTLVRSGLLTPDDNEASAAAGFLLAQYKDPVIRIESIDILPDTSAVNLYPQVFGRELGDRVLVNHRPPGGSTISQQSFIEGIEHNVAIGTLWKTTWRLSAVGIGYTLGSPIYLDSPSALMASSSGTAGVLIY